MSSVEPPKRRSDHAAPPLQTGSTSTLDGDFVAVSRTAVWLSNGNARERTLGRMPDQAAQQIRNHLDASAEQERQIVSLHMSPGSALAMEHPHYGEATVRATSQANEKYRYLVIVPTALRTHPDAAWIFSSLQAVPSDVLVGIRAFAWMASGEGDAVTPTSPGAAAFFLPKNGDSATLPFGAAGPYVVVALAVTADGLHLRPGGIRPFIVRPRERSAFEKGVIRGTYNTAALFASGAAAMAYGVGAERLSDYLIHDIQQTLQEQAERYPAQVRTIDEALTGVGPFLTYIAEAIVEQVPTLISMVIGGVICRVFAGAVAKTGAKYMGKSLTESEATALAVRASATWKYRGAFLGAFATNAELQTGEVYQGLLEIPGLDPSQKAVLVSLTGGVAAGFLETLVPFSIARMWGLGGKLTVDVAKQIAANPGLAQRLLTASAKGAATIAGATAGEGLTEALQEEISIQAERVFDSRFAWMGAENTARRKEAFAKGSIVGGFMGGVGHVGKLVVGKPGPTAQVKPTPNSPSPMTAARDQRVPARSRLPEGIPAMAGGKPERTTPEYTHENLPQEIPWDEDPANHRTALDEAANYVEAYAKLHLPRNYLPIYLQYLERRRQHPIESVDERRDHIIASSQREMLDWIQKDLEASLQGGTYSPQSLAEANKLAAALASRNTATITLREFDNIIELFLRSLPGGVNHNGLPTVPLVYDQRPPANYVERYFDIDVYNDGAPLFVTHRGLVSEDIAEDSDFVTGIEFTEHDRDHDDRESPYPMMPATDPTAARIRSGGGSFANELPIQARQVHFKVALWRHFNIKAGPLENDANSRMKLIYYALTHEIGESRLPEHMLARIPATGPEFLKEVVPICINIFARQGFNVPQHVMTTSLQDFTDFTQSYLQSLPSGEGNRRLHEANFSIALRNYPYTARERVPSNKVSLIERYLRLIIDTVRAHTNSNSPEIRDFQRFLVDKTFKRNATDYFTKPGDDDVSATLNQEYDQFVMFVNKWASKPYSES